MQILSESMKKPPVETLVEKQMTQQSVEVDLEKLSEEEKKIKRTELIDELEKLNSHNPNFQIPYENCSLNYLNEITSKYREKYRECKEKMIVEHTEMFSKFLEVKLSDHLPEEEKKLKKTQFIDEIKRAELINEINKINSKNPNFKIPYEDMSLKYLNEIVSTYKEQEKKTFADINMTIEKHLTEPRLKQKKFEFQNPMLENLVKMLIKQFSTDILTENPVEQETKNTVKLFFDMFVKLLISYENKPLVTEDTDEDSKELANLIFGILKYCVKIILKKNNGEKADKYSIQTFFIDSLIEKCAEKYGLIN